MAFGLTIHHDNLAGLARSYLRLWHAGAGPVDLAATGGDEFGPLWELSLVCPELSFTFTARQGAAQTDGQDRWVRALVRSDGGLDPGQVWCRGDRGFVYPVRPADPSPSRPGRSWSGWPPTPASRPGWSWGSAGGRSGLGPTCWPTGGCCSGSTTRPRPGCLWPAASTTGSTPATSGLTRRVG